MKELETTAGIPISSILLGDYFETLIDRFFKILPMFENEEDTLNVYMKSFQAELLGCQGLIVCIKENSLYLSLLSILQYLIDTPDCEVSDVKREVFRAISICNCLKNIYVGKRSKGGTAYGDMGSVSKSH